MRLDATLLSAHSEPFFFSPSEPRSGEESLRRDCFADETATSQ